MTMREFFNRRGLEAGIGLILAAVIVLVIVAVKLSAQESRQWAAFSEANHCKVVERRKGTSTTTTGMAIGSGGRVTPVVATSSTPSQTAYLCDDGVTYWR